MKVNPNYKEIEQLLADKEEFRHGYSMSAHRVAGEYVVFSYVTEIGRYDFNSGTWVLNLQKYSVTTSKQQNILKRVANAN